MRRAFLILAFCLCGCGLGAAGIAGIVGGVSSLISGGAAAYIAQLPTPTSTATPTPTPTATVVMH